MSKSSTLAIDTSTERLLNVHEIAEWLGVSRGTLDYWRHVHKGPPFLKVGGAVRYRPSEVAAWVRRGR
jgi:excisionase family DNA binding protein